MNANKHNVACVWLEIGFGKEEGILSCFQDLVFELELFPKFWKVLLVEIESIGVSANVQKSVREEFFRVSPKSVVEEISVTIVLKQRLPTLCYVCLQITDSVHLKFASVEHSSDSRNLDLKEFWLHTIISTEILDWV